MKFFFCAIILIFCGCKKCPDGVPPFFWEKAALVEQRLEADEPPSNDFHQGLSKFILN